MGLQKKTVDALGGMAFERVSMEELTLEVVEGPHRGKTLRLDSEITRIGREEWCEFSLPDDPWISNTHCECWMDEKGLRVLDLNSSNGVKIGDTMVMDAYLSPGSRIRLGQSVLVLHSHQQKKDVSIHFHDQTHSLVGRSLAMRKLFTLLPRLAKRNINTLLYGETGTGKTSIARAIHQHKDSQSPFVVVNCGALPESLISAALFGHEKGAFTGADKRHLGFFEQANGGTLFLDEIAELPLDLQPKLLDVLERRVVRRLGSEQEHPVDFQLITATHRNLEVACEAGRFREDLFFRISVMQLSVPPLRERMEDIPLLVEAFLKELHPDQDLYLTGAATQKLKDYLWPGNVRELRNILERTLVFLDGNTIDVDDLPLPSSAKPSKAIPASVAQRVSAVSNSTERPDWFAQAFPALPLSQYNPPLVLKDILKGAERFFLAQALEESELNAPEAAKLLTLSESWLYGRIKQYGLKSQRKKSE